MCFLNLIACSFYEFVDIQDACRTLKDRIRPYKKAMPNGTWKDWVYSAYADRVSLSAAGFYKCVMPGFHHSVSVLPLPFRCCKISLFCKKLRKKIPFHYSRKQQKKNTQRQRQRQRCTETATANGNGETATEERQRNGGNQAFYLFIALA